MLGEIVLCFNGLGCPVSEKFRWISLPVNFMRFVFQWFRKESSWLAAATIESCIKTFLTLQGNDEIAFMLFSLLFDFYGFDFCKESHYFFGLLWLDEYREREDGRGGWVGWAHCHVRFTKRGLHVKVPGVGSCHPRSYSLIGRQSLFNLNFTTVFFLNNFFSIPISLQFFLGAFWM